MGIEEPDRLLRVRLVVIPDGLPLRSRAARAGGGIIRPAGVAVGDAVVCSRRFTIASAGFHDQGCGVRLDCIVELNAVGTRGKAAERAQIDRRGNAVNVQIRDLVLAALLLKINVSALTAQRPQALRWVRPSARRFPRAARPRNRTLRAAQSRHVRWHM